MKIRKAEAMLGTIQVPGDKSISHRAAILASMAVGDTRIENYSTAKDCQTTLNCLKALGVRIEQNHGGVLVRGVGKKGFQKSERPLDCGNSGTTMRLLAGVLAGQNFESILVGDESLNKRPMQRIVDPLEKMGARIATENGTPPLTVRGTHSLQRIEYSPEIASAQIKSSILLAGLNVRGRTVVIEPTQTRDHTERMLECLGVKVNVEKEKERSRIVISGDAVLTARDITIPPDISSAAFFMVGAACLSVSDITIQNTGINPTRTAVLELLRECGAGIETANDAEICNEPVATIRMSGGLKSPNECVVIDAARVAALIDEIPIVAILGTQLDNGMEIHDAKELRVKESDRIAAIVENLKRMSARVTEFEDGFKVERSQLTGAVVDSFGDHRIAMAFAIAALLAEGETEIIGAECADISFPGFFDTLASVVD